MRRRLLPLTAILTALLCGLLAAHQGNVSSPGRAYVEFEPLDTVTVTPGHTTPVQFTFHVKSGYHINSNQPTTPELIPSSLTFSPPPDLVIAKVQYPAGHLTSFPFDPTQKLSVYSGAVTIKAVIIPQRHAAPGTYTVHGEFKYQACDNDACYPPKKLPIQFDLEVAKAAVKPTTPRPTRQSAANP